MKAWIVDVSAKTTYIEKASLWENGDVESFNGELRDELLNGKVFHTLREAQVLIEECRQHYNPVQTYSSLRCRSPVLETVAKSQNSSAVGATARVN